MSHRRKLVAGNWKLHGTRESVSALATAIVTGASDIDSDILVCPVAVHLADLSNVVDGTDVQLGGQNCAAQPSGAFTGEVAAPMLAEYGCRYVIVGHSERRQLFGESDIDVAGRAAAAIAASLSPIVCVGETLEEREAGRTLEVVSRQLDAVLDALEPTTVSRMVVAYEPVWAIGTGKTASPAEAQEVHAAIRQQLPKDAADSIRIVYGGSVKPDNAAELFAEQDIDGGLIGGASLDAASFLAIGRAANPTA